eukprot:15479462-Alexandrium_andersonii.AAC.1
MLAASCAAAGLAVGAFLAARTVAATLTPPAFLEHGSWHVHITVSYDPISAVDALLRSAVVSSIALATMGHWLCSAWLALMTSIPLFAWASFGAFVAFYFA